MFKKICLTVFVIWLHIPLIALAQTQIDLSSVDDTDCRVISHGDAGVELSNTISSLTLRDLSSDRGDFIRLDIPGYVKAGGEKGTPQFPALNRLIEIPQRASVSVTVNTMKEQAVNLNDPAGGRRLAPRQPPRSKSLSADEATFYYNEKAYLNDTFIEPENVTVTILGTMRSTRLARVSLCPFRYNPVTNQLMVATSMTVSLSFDNGDMALTRKIKKKYGHPLFNSALGCTANTLSTSRTKDALIDDTLDYPLTYVVVTHNDYSDNAKLAEFISWKKLLGYHVIKADTDDIYPSSPTTADMQSSLKTYLQDLYDDGDTPPVYVLFVGNVDQIPSYVITPNITVEDVELQDHVTDLTYCDFTGDLLPEAYYGRLPVQNDIELNAALTKTLNYEKFELTSSSYLDSCLLVAGADRAFGPVHANGQVAYLINEYFNTGSGFTNIYAFLYNESWDWSGSVTTDSTGKFLVTSGLINTLETGVGFTSYSGHCGSKGWANKEYSTARYELDSDDINDTLAESPYGFYVANCCESSRFELDHSESSPGCFGTTLILSENKGAVAYVGASNITFWDEDFFWAVGYNADILDPDSVSNTTIQNLSFDDTQGGNFDDLWHDETKDEDYETPEKWYTTAGQMVYSGNLSVMKNISEFNVVKYYWEVYNVLGDPSLSPYLTEPGTISAPTRTPTTLTPCEDTSLTVTDAPAYSLVALSKGGTLMDSALADVDGEAELSFKTLKNQNPENLTLMISKQNLQPQKTVFASNAFPAGLAPVANFRIGNDASSSPVEVYYGQAFTATNASTGCPHTYLWSFGGTPTVSSASAPIPRVTYEELGSFDAVLTVTNYNGSDTETKTNYILVSPYVALSYSSNSISITPGSTVTFSDTTEPSDLVTSRSWTFQGGSPSSSTEKIPQVIYNSEGTFSVELSVVVNGKTYTPTKSYSIVVSDSSSLPVGGGGDGGCFITTTP